jgi:hypothetical protein
MTTDFGAFGALCMLPETLLVAGEDTSEGTQAVGA